MINDDEKRWGLKIHDVVVVGYFVFKTWQDLLLYQSRASREVDLLVVAEGYTLPSSYLSSLKTSLAYKTGSIYLAIRYHVFQNVLASVTL